MTPNRTYRVIDVTQIANRGLLKPLNMSRKAGFSAHSTGDRGLVSDFLSRLLHGWHGDDDGSISYCRILGNVGSGLGRSSDRFSLSLSFAVDHRCTVHFVDEYCQYKDYHSVIRINNLDSMNSCDVSFS